MALGQVTKFCDFQAEYEGSIPFTRSSPLRGVLSSVLHTNFCGSFAFVCAITVDRRRLKTNFVA